MASSEDQCPYNTVIAYMIKPLREKVKDPQITELEFSEILRNLNTILQFVSSLNELQTITHHKKEYEVDEGIFLHIIKDVCFPALYSLHLLADSDKINSERGRAVSLIARLVLESCHYVEDSTLPQVVTQLFIPICSASKVNSSSLMAFSNDDYHKTDTKEPLSQIFSLELFGTLLNDHDIFSRYLQSIDQLSIDKEEMLDQLFQTVMCCSQEEAFWKAHTITCKLFTHFPKSLRQQCEAQIWHSYTQPILHPDGHVDKEALRKSLYVFYCFKNYFFPLDASEKKELSGRISCNNFWLIVQSGLTSTDPAYRKLAMYVLKRLVDTCNSNSCSVNVDELGQTASCQSPSGMPLFWWSSQFADKLSQIWEDFILLIETLEEKQVHIIKPILPRMQKLTAATTTSDAGSSMLHSSWLVTIITRCFQHDSHYMSRWGALTLLTLDFNQVPVIQHGQLRYLSHDLLSYLQENKLYARYEGTDLGKSSPVGGALKGFFANLFLTISKEQKVEYLGNLLRIVCENTWGSIPLMFVFEGLSHIQPTPVIGPELLQLIRQLLQSCLMTHELLTKGAIQCFICQALVNLIDVEAVSLNELFSTFASFNREESLQRNTTLWKTVIEWLASKAVRDKWSDQEIFSLVSQYLKGDSENTESSVIVDGYKVVSVARMLVMFADVLELRLTPSPLQETEINVTEAVMKSPLGHTLVEISDMLSAISNRAYVNIGKVDRCLSLLYSLVKETGNCHDCRVDQLLKKQLSPHFTDMSYFIRNRLSTDLIKAGDIDEIKFYTDVLLSLGKLSGQCCSPQLKDLVLFANKALTVSIQATPGDEKLAEYDMLGTSGMKVLATVFNILTNQSELVANANTDDLIRAGLKDISVLDVLLPFSRKSANKEWVSRAQVGRVISQFISSKWKCQKYILQRWLAKGSVSSPTSSGSVDVEKILNDGMEDMAVGSGSSDIAVFEALEVIMAELITQVDSSFIPKLIDLSWSKVMEEKKNILFWKKLKALIPLVLHKSLLQQEKSTVFGTSLDEFLNKLCTLGSGKSGILYLVFDHLCRRSLQDDSDRQIASRLIPVLMDGCSMGSLHKRGERLWLEVCAYVESLGDSCSINLLMSINAKNDLNTRAILLSWLSRLKPDVAADHKFVMTFLQDLKSKYLTLAVQTTYKHFSNSLSHRQKHRMVLVFLLLADFIKEDACNEYLSMLWQALEIECNPSVRQNLEWLVMLLIRRFPCKVSCLWDIFKLYDNKRSVCVCSLFLIMSHIGVKLPLEMQEEYYSRALRVVLPWTMAHHYNTRIFAQATLARLWDQCKSQQLESTLTQCSIVQQTVDFLFENSNASVTVRKLLSIYMYAAFDPVRDFSMETVFHTLPRLACLADDEWILPRQFVQIDETWKEKGEHLIPLYNPSDKLAVCKEGPWRTKAHVENEDDMSESADGDVQKKIMPWRQMSPDQETEAELASQRQRRSEDGLILVTTLIDKVPNLGGLCRTSEIFGVSEFVIGSLTHLEDRMFQSLSVSAQKWIKITEVMIPRLLEFLQEKQMQGYTLVGVEQTANSVSVQGYQFPKKTLLLLGNEKEGIPVEIIQMLDVCVEIPQLGVIRSLNVHVCGALIVWEYTRQHMGGNNSGAGKNGSSAANNITAAAGIS